MPHRTRGWVWAGRTAAAVAVAGLAVYLGVAGLGQAGKVAAPAGLVIAAAGLAGPYLFPAYQRPADPPGPAPGSAPPAGGVVIVADHGSVAAQHIGEVTMNPPRPDPAAPDGGGAG
jgi:hypothetical protein